VTIRFADQKRSKHVNFLYAEDNNVRHFALIKDLSRLVRLPRRLPETRRKFLR